MKFPWSSTKKTFDKPVPIEGTHPIPDSPTHRQIMTDSLENESAPVLTFDDKRYDLNSLPDELKELLTGLQVAEAQMRMQEDNLKVLAIGRDAIANQVSEQLTAIIPLP